MFLNSSSVFFSSSSGVEDRKVEVTFILLLNRKVATICNAQSDIYSKTVGPSSIVPRTSKIVWCCWPKGKALIFSTNWAINLRSSSIHVKQASPSMISCRKSKEVSDCLNPVCYFSFFEVRKCVIFFPFLFQVRVRDNFIHLFTRTQWRANKQCVIIFDIWLPIQPKQSNLKE